MISVELWVRRWNLRAKVLFLMLPTRLALWYRPPVSKEAYRCKIEATWYCICLQNLDEIVCSQWFQLLSVLFSHLQLQCFCVLFLLLLLSNSFSFQTSQNGLTVDEPTFGST